MRGVRVRWAGAAKVAALAIAALVALQTLPELLKPPAPPPLAEDVGLPRVVPKDAEKEPEPRKLRFETDAQRPKRTARLSKSGAKPKLRFETDARRPKGTTGSEGRRKHPPPMPEPPAYAPSPVPAPVPPPAASAPVGDGSE